MDFFSLAWLSQICDDLAGLLNYTNPLGYTHMAQRKRMPLGLHLAFWHMPLVAGTLMGERG